MFLLLDLSVDCFACLLYLSNEMHFDINKLFVAGYSNGGEMVYILGCKYSSMLSGISSISGTMYESTRLANSCKEPNISQLSSSIPILAIHGKNDKILKFDGDMTTSAVGTGHGGGAYQSQNYVVNYWKTRYSCSSSNTITLPGNSYYAPFKGNVHSGGVIMYKYSSCRHGGTVINNPTEPSNSQLWFYEISTGTHEYNLISNTNSNDKSDDVVTSVAVWDFFQLFI